MDYNLINFIYNKYPDIAKAMCSYYGQSDYSAESIDKDMFLGICGNFINNHPSIVFNFLELNDVELSVMGKFGDGFFGYKIQYLNSINWGNDCESKHEAECRVVIASVDLLDISMKQGKELKYKN